MNFLFFLIKRLFISKKSSAVFRITNLITILSLSLGIASLNIVSSSIAGFESAIAQKLSDLNGYSTINHLFEDEFDSREYKSLIPDGGIQYLEKYALLKSKKNSQLAARTKKFTFLRKRFRVVKAFFSCLGIQILGFFIA